MLRAILPIVVVTCVASLSTTCAQNDGARVRAAGAHGFEACSIDPERYVTVDDGDIGLVLSSTHAGSTRPEGCDAGSSRARSLSTRTCNTSLDLACQSGPCRASGPDDNARLLTFTLRDDLARCLGKRPALAVAEVARDYVDMNRDADDEGGPRCALEDPAARPLWEAYHRAVERLVARAVHESGDHALLVDVHTFSSLPKAPAPAIMIGTGIPVGLTLPHQAREDAALPLVFGANGLRTQIVDALKPSHAKLRVLPDAATATADDVDGLFMGRYVVRRYSRNVADAKDGPAIDSIQIEVSRDLRDDVDTTAAAIAHAICAVYGDRLRAPPTNASTNASTATTASTNAEAM